MLDKNNVVLSIENIYGPNYSDVYLSTSEDLLYYTDYFKSDCLVCLDAGHAVARSQDPIEMIKKIKNNIKALHLHSNIPGNDLHLPPCFINNYIDWQRFYRALTDISYSGTFNMEIRAPRQMNLETTIAYYRMAYGIADGMRPVRKFNHGGVTGLFSVWTHDRNPLINQLLPELVRTPTRKKSSVFHSR